MLCINVYYDRFPLQQTRIFLLELQSIIGSSREITELRALIKIVGPSDATVMILGDSGTGKELVAKALHGCSDRAQGPFIPINCGAIPKDLLESELLAIAKVPLLAPLAIVLAALNLPMAAHSFSTKWAT